MMQLKENTEELQTVNRRLKTLAERDGLTGLYNYRHFRESLDVTLSYCRERSLECSLIFSDIDHFKEYNDSQGHVAGDDLLRKLGKILRDGSRKADVTARYGGEEFVMILPGSGKEEAEHCAERIRQAVARHEFPGREQQPMGRVTLSLGVATFPFDEEDASALIECADRALYHAKNQGRNRTCAWSEDSIRTVVACVSDVEQ
jgi:diguanylate cyclase (GGDEF)-like protein